jgi:superfamily II DNA helicase RecQ
MEMRNVWGLESTPYPFQLHCVRSLIWPYRSESPKVLSVQATGKGKSLCMQAAGTLLGGVTLVLVPLLALGGDQVTKIRRANQVYSVVKGYHLDELKHGSLRHHVIQELSGMTPHNKKKAIFLFSSPQAIVNDRNPWCSILKTQQRLYRHSLEIAPQFYSAN